LPLAVEIRVKNPGVYHVDEIRLSRVG